MFYKLVSNLPFTPGLIDQVSFYVKRLKREEVTRRYGLIFMALAVSLQIFAMVSPPEASLASSTNDIIYGGGSKESIINVYRSNRDSLGRTDIQAIFHYFGIDETVLNNTQIVSIQSRAENDFRSVGRHHKFSFDIAQDTGPTVVYMRPLHAWDSGAYSTYSALRGVNKNGREFWILLNCGNIVMNGPYTPAYPDLQIIKSSIPDANTTVKPGDTIKYKLAYRNAGQGAATNMQIQDITPEKTELVDGSAKGNSPGDPVTISGKTITWRHGNTGSVLGPSTFYHSATFEVKVSDKAQDGDKICNTAVISSSEGSKTSNEVCHTVNVVAPPPPPPETQPIITLDKKVKNVTQGLEDANETTAQPGDVLEYTLITSNVGTKKANNHELDPEDMSDVLEYADIEDLDDGVIDMGTGIVKWSKVDIDVNSSVTKTIIVRVKNPLPSTPVSTSDPASYDLIMENVYGTSHIRVNLPAAPVKQIERTTQQLPNTGIGANIVFLTIISMCVAYFYSRNRLMTKELSIIKREYNQGI